MEIEPLEGKAKLATVVPEGCTLVMFDGSVRSSKTISSLLMWLRFLRVGPSGALVIVGRTETTAINNVVMPLQDMLGTHRVVLNRGLGIVTILGRVVQLYGANDAAAYTKIQGMTLAGAYVDEGAVIAESFFNMLRSRLSVPGAMLFLTCNPEGPKHWLKVNWLDRATYHLDRDGNLHHFEKWNEDGTAYHLPLWRVTFLLDDNRALTRNNPQFIRDLKASWPAGSVFHRRYIRSEWVSAEGSVYGVWNEPAMTLLEAELPEGVQSLMVGVDYGTTHNTRAYLLGWGTDDGRTKLFVLDEFAPPSATVGEHVRLFKAWLLGVSAKWGEPEWIAYDHAAAVFQAELFEQGVVNVMKAHKAVVPGIQTVQSLLYSRSLYVVRDNCPKLVGAIPGYMWSTKATERGATEPVKENDDEVDALRYAVYTSRVYWRDRIPLAPILAEEDEAA